MEKIIKQLKSKLDNNNIDFAFIGSVALWLRGVKIDPDDIDIVTDDVGVKKASSIFGSKLIFKRGFWETYFDLKNIPVQILSYQNNPVREFDFASEKELVGRNNQKYPCMSLDSELKVYRELNRTDDQNTIKIIKKLIKNN